jgi:Tol biopolymer transport system component/DNA-binding winged helix-turn-helix (wHTH) protein
MTASGPSPDRIRFEGFEADLHTEELFKSGRKLRLPQQSFRVLAMLLERPGHLVAREQLRARLWPAGALVEYDQGLNAAVNRLREALGDSAEAPRFIETLPRRGYRFIAAIEQEVSRPSAAPEPAPPNSVAAVEPTTHSRAPTRSRLLLMGAAGLVALLFIAGTLWVMTHHPAVSRFPAGRSVLPLASLPGQAVGPTFSPDGSEIAFAWNGAGGESGLFDLYVKSLGSERLLRLTHHPAAMIRPAWSPDGRMIAFLRREADQVGLFVVPALGGSERRLVSGGVVTDGFSQISWSPDGRVLAYAGYGSTGAAQIQLVSLDSLSTRPLSPAPGCQAAAQPAFSPDGTQMALVCVSSTAVYSIDVVGLPDGPVRRLASVQGYPQGLAWVPDGSRLIFSKNPGDEGELWQVTLSGEMTQLPFGEEGGAPAVAPRGGRMAYVRGRSNVDIWRMDLTAAHPEESAAKLIYSTRVQVNPRYSPDGTHIAFQSNRSGSSEIWITDAQGAEPDRLTSFNGPYTGGPSWCSDGRRIAFDSRASGVSEIYVEDVSERVPRRVVTSRDNLSIPAWSQDCRWLFASEENYRLYRLPAAGGPAERFTDKSATHAVVVGARVLFGVTDPNGLVLWSKPVAGGQEAPVENLPRLRYDDAWTATNSGIYFTDSSSKPVKINFYDFASRTTRTLLTVKDTPIPGVGLGLAVSPDGHWLLYAQAGVEDSEIMLAPEP